jgi:hypothetical protein
MRGSGFGDREPGHCGGGQQQAAQYGRSAEAGPAAVDDPEGQSGERRHRGDLPGRIERSRAQR